MDAPSSVSVAQCIAHAVLPKPENKFDHELWPMHGLMEMLHHDNGKDLRNRGLERGCEEHGIKLRWRPPLTPHFGGHIERMMGTLMKLIHGLKGTTYSNPKEKGDYASEDRATMTLPEVREWLVDAICRLYHARRHRELGIPPIVAWERAWGAANGGAIHPPVPARSGDFKMDFLPFEVRRLQRTGIAFDRTRYWHSDLAPFVGPSRHVICRYDPRDPMRIWVDLGDQVLIEAAAVAGRAIKSIAIQPIDKVMQAHLNARIDKGFQARDEIETWAATSTRRQRRSQPKRKLERDHSSGKRGGRRHIQGADVSPIIQAPLIVPDSFDATVTDLGL
jgi:putative transposase